MPDIDIYTAHIRAQKLAEELLLLYASQAHDAGDVYEKHYVSQVGRAYDDLDQSMQKIARNRAARLTPKPALVATND